MPVLLFLASLVCCAVAYRGRKSSERRSGKTSWQFLLWKNALEFLEGVLIATTILSIIWIAFVFADLDTKSLSTLRAIERFFATASTVGKWLKGPIYSAVLVYVALFVLGLLSVSRAWKPGKMLANIGLKCADVYFNQVKRWTVPIAILTSFTFLGGTLGSQIDSVDLELKSAKTSLELIGKCVRQRMRESVASDVQSRVIDQQPARYEHVIARGEQLNRREPHLEKRIASARRYGVEVAAVENELAARSARAQAADKAVEAAIEAEKSELPPLKPDAERNVSPRKLDQIRWTIEGWAYRDAPAQQLMEKLGKPLPGKVLSAVFTPKGIPIETISHLATDYPIVGAFLQVFTSAINDRIKSRIEPAVVKYVNSLIVQPSEKVKAELRSEAHAIAEFAPVEWKDDPKVVAELLVDVSKQEAHLAKRSNGIDAAIARRASEISVENERRLAALAPQIDPKIHVLSLLGHKIFFTSWFVDAIRNMPDPIDRQNAIAAASRVIEQPKPSAGDLYKVVYAYLTEPDRKSIERVLPNLPMARARSPLDPGWTPPPKRLGQQPFTLHADPTPEGRRKRIEEAARRIREGPQSKPGKIRK